MKENYPERKDTMRKETRFAAAGLVVLLSAAAPAQAWAAATDSPEFSRTAEEWARLQDNTLEYDEIADLVHEYNTTVLNNRVSYRDYLGKDRDDVARRYRDAAQELRDNIEYPDDPTDTSYATMLMAAQLNETQAKSLEEQADNNVDDSQSIYLQYEMVEANLVLATKLNLIAYNQKLLSNGLTEENRSLLEAQYQAVQVQASVGSATQTDVLNARQALEQLESTSISDAKETQTLKQQICLAAGWNYDADPVFGELPQVDPAQIAAIDLEADKARALENNYTLKISRRQYENSTSSATRENLQNTIRDNEQNIASDITSKYQSLLEAQSSYNLALTQQAVEAQTLAAVQQRFQTGAASQLEYLQESYNMSSRNTAVETAALSLLSAWETYQGAVNGLASASASS